MLLAQVLARKYRFQVRRSLRNNGLALLDSREHLDLFFHLPAKIHGADLKRGLRIPDEHDIPVVELLYGRDRNAYRRAAKAGGQFDCRKHVELELGLWIGNFTTNSGSAGLRIENVTNVSDLPREPYVRICVHANERRLANLYAAQILFIHLRLDPYLRKIGNCEQLVVRI